MVLHSADGLPLPGGHHTLLAPSLPLSLGSCTILKWQILRSLRTSVFFILCPRLVLSFTRAKIWGFLNESPELVLSSGGCFALAYFTEWISQFDSVAAAQQVSNRAPSLGSPELGSLLSTSFVASELWASLFPESNPVSLL